MKISKVYVILFSVQFIIVVVLLQQPTIKANQIILEKQIENLQFQNQEMKNVLLKISAKYDSMSSVSFDKHLDCNSEIKYESKNNSTKQILILNKDLKNILSEKLSEFRSVLVNSTKNCQRYTPTGKDMIKQILNPKPIQTYNTEYN
ncbi:MAG: hypothetical protein ACC656_12510 [Candidatus Heimdallarchaeota archaeon]